MCASTRVANPRCAMKVKAGPLAGRLRWEGCLAAAGTIDR